MARQLRERGGARHPAVFVRGNSLCLIPRYTIESMSQITLNLPDSAAAELADVSREANRNPEDVASELLQRVLLIRRFDRAQDKVSGSLRADAPKSEDEAFEHLS